MSNKKNLSHINNSLIPTTYKTVGHTVFKTRGFRNAVSGYTGFVAGFYEDGQIAFFTYVDNKGVRYPFLHLQQHGIEGGFVGNYGSQFGINGESYSDGMFKDENPWSDRMSGTPAEFSDWVQKAIRQVIRESREFSRSYSDPK